MRLRPFSSTLLFVLALAMLGRAQSTADEHPPTAEEHLRRGVELRRAGRDYDSLVEFEAAYRLSPEPRTAAQLGLARQSVGRWLDADRYLREALVSQIDPWVVRNRAALETALAVVGGHVGEVEVRCNVVGAQARIEDTPPIIVTLPRQQPLRVLAGTVSLVVSADGFEPVTRRFVLEPDALVRETIELRPLAPSAQVQPSAPPSPRIEPGPLVPAPTRVPAERDRVSNRRIPAIVSLSGGALSLGVGIVALAYRQSAALEYNDHCPPPPAPNGTACGDLQNTELLWRSTAFVTIPVGIALAALGVTLLSLPSRRGHPESALSCAPFVTERGLACQIRF